MAASVHHEHQAPRAADQLPRDDAGLALRVEQQHRPDAHREVAFLEFLIRAAKVAHRECHAGHGLRRLYEGHTEHEYPERHDEEDDSHSTAPDAHTAAAGVPTSPRVRSYVTKFPSSCCTVTNRPFPEVIRSGCPDDAPTPMSGTRM